MKYILLLLLLLCFGFIVYLILENRKIKKRQLQNINKMQTLIMSLHQQQLYLNDKVFISSEYDFNYRKKIKPFNRNCRVTKCFFRNNFK